MKIENSLQSKNLSKIQKIFANQEKYFVSGHLQQQFALCHQTAHCVALGSTRSIWSQYANRLNCTKCLVMFCHKCGKEFVSNELFCRQCGTLKRPKQKNDSEARSSSRKIRNVVACSLACSTSHNCQIFLTRSTRTHINCHVYLNLSCDVLFVQW